MSKIAEKLYIIFGAYGGIGEKVCEQLRQKQANIVVVGRDEEKLGLLAEKYAAHMMLTDATNIDAVDQCVKEVITNYGQPYGIVNCVGSIMLKPAHLLTEKDWQQTLNTNLNSAFAVVKGAAKHMLTTGGSIVLMSTAACLIGLPNHEAISAAKAGVNGLMKAAAASYAERGLRFNSVAPGLVATPLTQHLTTNPKAAAASLGMHGLSRLGQAKDIANMICFLLDPENDWITGQVYTVDGGLASIKKLK